MATMKRRVVYLTDSEWRDIRKWADDRGLTASAFLRHAARLMDEHSPKDKVDRAIQTVNARRDFAEFHPAPKPGRR